MSMQPLSSKNACANSQGFDVAHLVLIPIGNAPKLGGNIWHWEALRHFDNDKIKLRTTRRNLQLKHQSGIR